MTGLNFVYIDLFCLTVNKEKDVWQSDISFNQLTSEVSEAVLMQSFPQSNKPLGPLLQ